MLLINSQTTFVYGSSSIKALDNNTKKRLDGIMSVGINIVVGQNNFDYLIQQHLAKAKYNRVCVYHDRICRHNLNNWQTRHVKGVNYLTKIMFTKEEAAMADDANYGLAIWDGQSLGTEVNTNYMVAKNKKVSVYQINKKSFIWC